MMEIWKKHVHNGDQIGVILMDLFKVFDTRNPSLLLAKLGTFGFSSSSLKLMQSYLCNRFQRTKVNGSFSDWAELLPEVPQDSIFASLLFNVFLNDIFLFITNSNLCKYADDSTLHTINHQ